MGFGEGMQVLTPMTALAPDTTYTLDDPGVDPSDGGCTAAPHTSGAALALLALALRRRSAAVGKRRC